MAAHPIYTSRPVVRKDRRHLPFSHSRHGQLGHARHAAPALVAPTARPPHRARHTAAATSRPPDRARHTAPARPRPPPSPTVFQPPATHTSPPPPPLHPPGTRTAGKVRRRPPLIAFTRPFPRPFPRPLHPPRPSRLGGRRRRHRSRGVRHARAAECACSSRGGSWRVNTRLGRGVRGSHGGSWSLTGARARIHQGRPQTPARARTAHRSQHKIETQA